MFWMKVPEISKIKSYCFLLRIVYNLIIKAVSSAVEHLPYKQMATGSNPVPPIVKHYKYFNFEYLKKKGILTEFLFSFSSSTI